MKKQQKKSNVGIAIRSDDVEISGYASNNFLLYLDKETGTLTTRKEKPMEPLPVVDAESLSQRLFDKLLPIPQVTRRVELSRNVHLQSSKPPTVWEMFYAVFYFSLQDQIAVFTGKDTNVETKSTLVTIFIRWFLKVVGGALAGIGIVGDEATTIAAGVASIIIGIVMTLYERYVIGKKIE